MKKEIAEFIGTFTLVLIGCGSAVIAGADIGLTGISFAFGLALIGMAYGIGPVSGCHINPAVSLGMVAAGRMKISEAIRYIIAQTGGAIVAALVLLTVASGKADYSVGVNGLGQNGWGAGYLGEYSIMAAFTFELVATFLFMVVILGATGSGASTAFAGLAIGLTLVAIHLVGINVTGVSVNPARSVGPALFAGATAIGQLWLFIVAPIIGAVAAAMVGVPFECLKHRVQLGAAGYSTPLSALASTLENDGGVQGLYTGLRSTLARNKPTTGQHRQ